MEEMRSRVAPMVHGPRFYVTGRQPLQARVVLLAAAIAFGALAGVGYGLVHSRSVRRAQERASSTPVGSSSSDPAHHDDKKDDDPDQVDTIVLGDAADAPVPARKNAHVSPVHATVIVRLPRFGAETGLIPDSSAGHLLYDWLAAFNQGSSAAMDKVLPNAAGDASVAAQMVLRFQTGGFALVSAKEIAPGVMVFRMHDETPAFNEVLGTLVVRKDSKPPEIATLSLRAAGVPLLAKTKKAAE